MQKITKSALVQDIPIQPANKTCQEGSADWQIITIYNYILK